MTLASILGVLLGGGLTLFGIWLKLALDSSALEKRTSAIVFAEWADIARHYDRNVDRLRSMQRELTDGGRWPERVHIEKLKWPEDTYIFDSASVQYSPAKTVTEIYKMRLRLRNANLDADAAMRAFLSGKKVLFMQALAFVEGRHYRLEGLALQFLGKVRKPLSDAEDAEAKRSTADMLFFDEPLLT